MKTVVLSMISIAATIAAMTACTSESDPVDEINPKDAKVEIKLGAGVTGVETKAITTDEGLLSFSNATVPLFRLDGTLDPDWSSAEASANATINDNAVTLDNSQLYYPENDNAYFIGYYSELTPTTVKNVISFSGVDGTKDIICTDQTDAGSRATPATAPELIFKHMLSKVEIKVAGTPASAIAFGKITKVELLEIPGSLDLTLNKVSTIAANANPNVQNISLFEGEQKILEDATTIGAIPMIFNGGDKPYGSSNNALKIKITTEKGVFPIEVKTINNGLANGKKHTITLTFKDQITISSKINPWENDGESGSEDVG